MGKFEMLCGMLPAEVNWGDPITPQMVEEIAMAEREAWRGPVMEMQEAVLDTMASGRPVAHLDSAVGALVSLLRSNFEGEQRP